MATIVRIRLLPTMANLDDVLCMYPELFSQPTGPLPIMNNFFDFDEDAGTDAMIWTIIEAGLAIIAASLATIRPLLRVLRVRGFESSDSCENVEGLDLQALEPRPDRQRRFLQFYGINDMPLTHDTRPATIFCFHHDDTKSQHVQLDDTGREP